MLELAPKPTYAELEAENARLRGRVEALEAENVGLRRRVTELDGQVTRLTQQVTEALRASKRQAAPFSKGTPSSFPGCLNSASIILRYGGAKGCHSLSYFQP